MNENDGKPEEERCEEEGGNTHPPVPVIDTAKSAKEAAKSADQTEEATALQTISRWDRFREWFLKITVAEAGMLLLTLVIAGSGIYYTKYAKRQWRVMRDQLPELHTSAEAAKSSADTAASQLELAERPWVDADIALAGPLTFDTNANIPVIFSVRNTGNSPALSTNITPTPFVGAGNAASATNNQAKLCQDAMQVVLKNPWIGNALFPKVQPFIQPMNIAIPVEYFTKNNALSEFPDSKFPSSAVLAISIVVCIAYRPSFDDTTAYYTSYIVDLRKTEKGKPMFTIGENLNRNQLMLQFSPIGAIKVGKAKTK